MPNTSGSEVVDFISDEDRTIARLAGVAAIRAGLNAEVITLNATRKDILFRALHLSRDYSGEEVLDLPEVTLDTVEKLWSSSSLTDRVLALQVLPLSTASEQYVCDRLMTIVREDTSREEVAAALSSLRISDAIRVFKQNDLKVVAKCLEGRTVDVRIEAGKLLSCFGGELVAVEAFLSRDLQDMDASEYRVMVRGISNASVLIHAASIRLCDQALHLLDPNRPLNAERLEAVLAAMQHMAKTATPHVLRSLQDKLADFRTKDDMKGKILTCLPAIMPPSSTNIRILKSFMDKGPIKMDSALVQMPCVLATKCKESVLNVEMSVSALSEMLPSLFSLYIKLTKRQSSEKNEALVSKLRIGITEITQLIVTFDEFLSVDRQTELHGK